MVNWLNRIICRFWGHDRSPVRAAFCLHCGQRMT